MKKRLWHSLLCAGVALVAALTSFTVAASAETRVLTVKLVSGEIVTVTVDVPPGTPTSEIQLPADLGPVEWVSGNEAQHPAGIYARGRTTGAAADGTMPVELTALSHPLLRSQLVGHPALAGMEVLRMPAGSNPSYVTPAQLRVLAELDPEIALVA